MRTSGFILLLLLSIVVPNAISAKCSTADMRLTDSLLVAVVDSVDEAVPDSVTKKKRIIPAWISSADVRVDLCGPLMSFMGIGFTQYEVGARVGIKNRYFPIAEFGVGSSDYVGETTGKGSHVNAPFFRVGCDYNFTKNNRHDSRFTLGLRYGFSSYTYDLSDKDFADAIWKDTHSIELNDIDGSMHWIEAVGSAETRLWRFIHLGWSVRYKFPVSQRSATAGKPWYVPGYGINDDSTWGANFNLIFEI